MTVENVNNTINDLIKEIHRLESENNDLFYKLKGVMWFVDKWLDGDELKQDEVNRAITMREKTLQITEKQQAEIEILKSMDDTQSEEIREAYRVGHNAGYCRGAISVVEKLKEHLCNYDLPSYHSFKAVDEDTIDEVLKELVGE